MDIAKKFRSLPLPVIMAHTFKRIKDVNLVLKGVKNVLTNILVRLALLMDFLQLEATANLNAVTVKLFEE